MKKKLTICLVVSKKSVTFANELRLSSVDAPSELLHSED